MQLTVWSESENPESESPTLGARGGRKNKGREVRVPGSESGHKREKGGWVGGVPLRLSRSYLVRGTDEVPNPKSEVRFVPLCSQSRLEIQNPQIRSPRWEQREQSPTQIQNPQIRSPKWSLRGKSESSQSEITKSLVQPGRGEKNSSRANPKSPNPKSDGALGEERAISETERVPVMSLIKSYRTRLLNPTG